MNQRINIQQLEPKAYEALFGLEGYLANSTLDKALCELVRLRASQINGCAYCIQLHSDAAIKLGVSHQKALALSAWWESPRFDEKERAVFAATDEITNISDGGVSDPVFNGLKAHFTDNEIAQLIMLIGTINIWNRIAISTHTFHH